MTWVEHKPSSWRPSKPDVVLSLSERLQGRAQRFSVTVRGATKAHLPWWKLSQHVRVLFGQGEHAGMVRIEPSDAGHELRRHGKGEGAFVLSFAAPPGAPAAALKRAPVEFDFNEDWLELTLPWASRAAKPAAPAPAASRDLPVPPKPAKPKPYNALDYVPDPVAVLQAQKGGRVR